MPLVDDRGRLFGRINVIDATIVVFLLVLMPIVYTASRLFRVQKPEIESVEPKTQPVGRDRRIKVTGRNLRPLMKALVSPTGRPFALIGQPFDGETGNIVFETPSIIEVKLPPDLVPGSYDLHLFDTTQELVRLTNAFSLTAPPDKKPDETLAIVHARIRFSVLPEIVRLVHEGDTATTERIVENAGEKAILPPAPAVLRRFRVTTDSLPPTIDWGGGWGAKLIEADMDIPVRQNARNEWEYRQQAIRLGELFHFQTARYTMGVIIGEMTVSSIRQVALSSSEGK